MKERRLTEKTKLSLSIATLTVMILFIITSTTAAISWKTEVDYKIETNYQESKMLKDRAVSIEQKQAEQDTIFMEIKTDLKWIRSTLEKIQEN